jgi:predicted ribosomally synthesized peptide with SipW-like signal peptide
MKKHIILAVVVVAALALAGVGGVFATWSDSEISFDNSIATGSLDLKVNGADDQRLDAAGNVLWGEGVPTKFSFDCMVPQKFYGPYEVELWNAGQCQFPAHAYLQVKRIECGNVLPKVNPEDPEEGGSDMWPRGATTGYPAPELYPGDPIAGQLKPEPELVAEYGGKVNCFEVPGIGPEGDECSMGTHVEMIITLTTVPPNYPDAEIVARDKLIKWLGVEHYLFDLMPCEPKMIYLWFLLQQDNEEMYGYDFVPDPTDADFPDPVEDPEAYAAAVLHWKKFNDWPSWALMKDKAEIDVEFDLWLEDTPGASVHPDGTITPPPTPPA